MSAPGRVHAGEAGFLVTGSYCDRCGDTNYDDKTLVCLTCTYPDKERGYLDSRKEQASMPIVDAEVVWDQP